MQKSFLIPLFPLSPSWPKSYQLCFQNISQIYLLHFISSVTFLVQGASTSHSNIEIAFLLITGTVLPVSSLAHLWSIFHTRDQQNRLFKNYQSYLKTSLIKTFHYFPLHLGKYTNAQPWPRGSPVSCPLLTSPEHIIPYCCSSLITVFQPYNWFPP